jgi:N-acyl amino acid synthase of PEP-CTERM/exosortase system
VRLVLPSITGARDCLPIYEICDHPLLNDAEALPPHKTAEISRFSISKDFRRRREDGRYPNMATPVSREELREERRIMPHMTLGLMNAIVRMSVANDVTHWTAVMEPALLRLLARLGIRFEPLGPIVNYHGRRQPVYADAGRLLSGIWDTNREVWEVITEDGSLWPLQRPTAVA